MTPPPATISGRLAALISSTARRAPRAPAAGGRSSRRAARGTRPGTSNASACTSSGMRQRDRAGLGRIGQHPHRLERGRDQLLGALDPLVVARHRTEAVVDRHGRVVRHLEHLQHGVRRARGERVAGQQQHGQAVDRGQRRAGHHVGRPGTDRRRARERARRLRLTRVAGGDVDHALLVARRVVGQQVAVLVQRLAQPGDVAVTEDPVAAGDEPLAPAVALGLLDGQEAHQRLGHGQARHAGHHDDSTLGPEPAEHRVQIGQLDPERAGRGARVEPRVAGHRLRARPHPAAARRRRAARVEPEHPDRAARQADPVDVLAAAAVQDARALALERPPHELGGVGGERRRRELVEPRPVPDREPLARAQRLAPARRTR